MQNEVLQEMQTLRSDINILIIELLVTDKKRIIQV